MDPSSYTSTCRSSFRGISALKANAKTGVLDRARATSWPPAERCPEDRAKQGKGEGYVWCRSWCYHLYIYIYKLHKAPQDCKNLIKPLQACTMRRTNIWPVVTCGLSSLLPAITKRALQDCQQVLLRGAELHVCKQVDTVEVVWSCASPFHEGVISYKHVIAPFHDLIKKPLADLVASNFSSVVPGAFKLNILTEDNI